MSNVELRMSNEHGIARFLKFDVHNSQSEM